MVEMKQPWTPAAIASAFIALLATLSLASSMLAILFAPVVLNENQILYLFSTSAQVLAGIYGLTLTGFVFFRNELSREESEDETLIDAVEQLKTRYFSLLLFITTLVFTAILLANLAIAQEGYGGRALNTVIVNSAQSAFVTSLFAIAYFIFEVISPNRIEKASKSLQQGIDPSRLARAKGSLEEFLRNYNEIEMLLDQHASYYQKSVLTYQSRAQRRPSNSRLSELLFRSELISKSLFDRLKSLVTLRNSIIHGAEPVVSQALVQESAGVLRELRSSLARGAEDEQSERPPRNPADSD